MHGRERCWRSFTSTTINSESPRTSGGRTEKWRDTVSASSIARARSIVRSRSAKPSQSTASSTPANITVTREYQWGPAPSERDAE
jgi:hypothetical protein